ncbi:Type III restriction enzyme, res subunit [Nesidiocoris tenuis]|uniref:Type III restriction enzyme, res subunit n=1 Tax=Nesidiocoris tenuis TaxID=355587 RepID=A0ABN7B096_9HEMI|nr:Type III restriction enzyme, res subunit [Nesidiocoris tenuis]
MSLNYLLNDGNEDEILARVQEESLRHYREFELPRIENQAEKGSLENVTEEDDRSNCDTSCPSTSAGIITSDGLLLDKSVLCTQVGGKAGAILFEGEEAQGFHIGAGSNYIYPTNYPIRQYQAAIVRNALFKNTLVALPTGLGKTFIAAVVMYNFYRWYPRSKIVFMAPTRPLVAQQIKACYSIMGIPAEDTTEMTGASSVDTRKTLWKEKRVFFLTPQVLVNDLASAICPANLIKCVVFDEAHKATKEYAYCQVVRLLEASNAVYRTLALSATPGNDPNAVVQVIRNLNISCLEMRGEDSIDVKPYTHGKSVEQVVVDLSPELLRVKDDFMHIYEGFVRSLVEKRVLTSNIAFLSKFQILKQMEKFRANPPRGMSTTVIGSLVSDFTMCMTMAHALDLLQIYGLRAFYRYLADEGDKPKAAITRLRHCEDLQRMLRKLHGVLYPKPNSEEPYTWGHPKLKKLVSSLTDHFKKAQAAGEKSKAIVFCQYKVVVNEIVDMLATCDSTIKAAVFVGQSGGKEKGMPQSKQLQIMKDFREGKINCLVATCVAEEGLDIGEVDLIVLMESQKSPIRLVQRLGRTGRKRKGRCVVLLTRGKEEKKFLEAMASRKSYVKDITDSQAVKNSLCQYSPPMLPPGTKPQQQLVHIKITDIATPVKPVKVRQKQMDIRNCVVPEERPFLDDGTAQKLLQKLEANSLNFNRLPSRHEFWWRAMGPKISVDELLNSSGNNLASWNDWNTDVHESYVVSSTSSSKLYCDLLSRNAERDDPEFFKLVKEYRAGKIDAAIVGDINAESEEKKPKKKNPPKKNYGMDIRSCIAAAANRPGKVPKFDLSDDDIIIVDDEHHVQPALTRAPVGESSKFTNQQLLDMAAIFDMKADEFERILVGGDSCSDMDIKMCERLGKYLDDRSYVAPLPKIEAKDVDFFKIQCDQMVKLLETPDGIPLNFFNCTSCMVKDVNSIESIRPIPKIDNRSAEDDIGGFVDIDDLFADDEEFKHAGKNVNSVPLDRDLESIKKPIPPNCDIRPATPPPSDPFAELVEVSPIAVQKRSDDFPSNWALDSPRPNALSAVPVTSSTPLHPAAKRNPFSIADQPRKPADDEWDLDDILEDVESGDGALENGDAKDTRSKSKDYSSSCQDMFATTRSSKAFQKSKSSSVPSAESNFKTPVPPRKSPDDFLVDLDELFENEADVDAATKAPEDSSFYTVTQLVSQIEKEKRQMGPNVSKEPPIVSLQEVTPECHKARQPVSRSQNRRTNSTKDKLLVGSAPKNCVDDSKNTVVIIDSDDSCDILAEKHDGKSDDKFSIVDKNRTPDVVNLGSSQEEVGAVKSGLVEVELPKSKQTCVTSGSKGVGDAKNAAWERSLLDQDDDIFGDLNIDEHVARQKSTQPRNVPKLSQNVKKFKPKSLLSHLDSEPDNDSPEHKSSIIKEVNRLKVGSSPCNNTDNFLASLFGQKESKNDRPLSKNIAKQSMPKRCILDSESDNDSPERQQSTSTNRQSFGASSKRKLSFDCATGETSKYFAKKDVSLSQPLSKRKRVDSDSFSNETDSASPLIGRKGEKSRRTSLDSSPKPAKKRRKKRSKGAGAGLIDQEAEESGTRSTDDSDDSSLDELDSSFVDDASDQEQSYAYYLKSIKSPVGGGKFKIPASKQYKNDVYSQVVEYDNDYENDSFCVGDDEEISEHESSTPETAEKKRAGRKRIHRHESEGDIDERETLMDTVVENEANRKKKRRLLESDSDVTPERAPPKKRLNPLVSPEAETSIFEGKKDEKAAFSKSTGKVDLRFPSPDLHAEDSEEDLKKAIILSQMEAASSKDVDAQFEEDLKKALLLSQQVAEAPRPWEVPGTSREAEVGTSFLFLSQPAAKQKKPLTTNLKRGKVATSNLKKPFQLDFNTDESD